MPAQEHKAEGARLASPVAKPLRAGNAKLKEKTGGTPCSRKDGRECLLLIFVAIWLGASEDLQGERPAFLVAGLNASLFGNTRLK